MLRKEMSWHTEFILSDVLINLPWRPEVVLTVVFALIAVISIAKAKDRLLTVTCLAIGISVLETVLDAKVTLPLVLMPLLAISVYAAYKIDWKGALVSQQR
jgi:hypothetical protein